MKEYKDIPIADIELSGQNKRDAKRKKDGTLKDLIQSIKAFGFNPATPIAVRPHPTKKGKYELRAGERRLYACKKLKMEAIPAVIVAMDDIQAMEATLVENTERLDLNVSEQVNQVNEMLKVYGNDTKAIAAKLGLNEQQVRLRKNVTKNLSSKWKSWLKSDDSEAQSISMAHLDLIARLPKNVQDDFYSEKYILTRGSSYMPVKKLDEFLKRQYLRVLDTAPWDLDLKNGFQISCNSCKKRSDCKGQTELWDVETEEKEKIALCLDGMCWANRLAKVSIKKYMEALKQNKKLLPVTTESHTWDEANKLRAIFGVKSLPSWPPYCCYPKYNTMCKEDDSGAKAVFIIDGPDFGKIKYYRSTKNDSANGKPATKPKVKSLKMRRRELRGLRLKLVYPKLSEAILACDEPKDKSLKFAACVAIVYGASPNFSFCTIDKEKKETEYETFRRVLKSKTFDFGYAYKDDEKYTVDHAGALWLLARANFRSVVPGGPNAQEALKAEEQCRFVAELVGFDFDKALKEAEAEKPEPKSWKNLKADGTPK